jgi:predicted Zn-dependent protease
VTAEQELATTAVELTASALPGADVEAAADRHRLALTRFANSFIHQNVADDTTTVRIRVHHDGRTASSSATVTGEADVRAVVDAVAAAVKVAPLDPGWPGVSPQAEPGPTPAVEPATAAATPADRAQIVREFVDGAGGLETAGYCRTNHWSGAFANSAGQVATGEAAECGASGIARNNGADGVARAAPLALAELDGAALGARAAAKARASAEPIELGPGRYEVVLEPTAVADILETVAAVGLNGRAVKERRSFVRLGEEQFDPSVTIVDDPLSAGFGYDWEGTPRRRLLLVDRGTSVALTQDRRSAAEAGVSSTGHADHDEFALGPYARYLTLVPAGGDERAEEVEGPAVDSSAAELVGAVKRGILVSDFWYTRMLDPRTLAITGLTRNGVWLIEDGQLTKPLRNMRFTQSYAQAVMPGNVKAIGRTATAIAGDSYSAISPRFICPSLHLASWNFTGGASG